jgi:predicted RNase H-like HicB family nuclease
VSQEPTGTHRYSLRIHDERDGMLWAEVEELPGCFASGADMDELLAAAAESIALYVGEEGADVVPLRPARPFTVDRAEIVLEA